MKTTFKRKACEILDCKEACIAQEHARTETSWVCNKAQTWCAEEWKRKDYFVAVIKWQFRAEEGYGMVVESASLDKWFWIFFFLT